MPAGLFYVVQRNPNDTTGGGGCVCDEVHKSDCQPPYAVFPGNDMESTLSPHVVICQRCVQEVLEKMDGEILGGGELTPRIEQGYRGPTSPDPVDDEDDIPGI